MRTFLNSVSASNTYLHKSAKILAETITSAVAEKKELAYPIICVLGSTEGAENFDQLSRTKTVELLAQKLNEEQLVQYLDSLISKFDSESTLAVQKIAFDRIQALMKPSLALTAQNAVDKIVKFIAENAFFMTSSEELNAHAQTKLFALMNDLINASSKNNKTANYDSQWIDQILSVVGSRDDVEPATANDEELQDAKTVVDSIMTKAEALSSDDAKNTQKLAIFKLFVRVLSVQAHFETDVLEAFADLETIFTEIFEPNSKKRTHEDSEELNPYDVLTDIVVGLLAKPSALLRNVCELVFKTFSDGLTKNGIQLLFDIFEKKEEKEEETGDAMDVDEEDSGDSDSDESSEDSDADINIAEDEKMLQGIDFASLQANMKAEASDSDELSDLGDDEMQAFDDKLVEIFKQRKEMSQAKKMIKVQTEHYKLRVLDLIEIYLKKQSENPLFIHFFLPCLRLFLKTGNQPTVFNKVVGIMKARFCKVKDVPKQVDATEAIEILKEVHNIASKVPGKDLGSICSAMSLTLCKMIKDEPVSEVSPKKKKKSKGTEKQAQKKFVKDQVYDVYESSLESMMTKKKNEMPDVMFVEYTRRYVESGVKLSVALARLLSFESCAKSYMFVRGVALINQLLSSIPKKDEASFKSQLEEAAKVLKASMDTVFEHIDAQGIDKVKQVNKQRAKEIFKNLVNVQKKLGKMDIELDVAEYETKLQW